MMEYGKEKKRREDEGGGDAGQGREDFTFFKEKK